MKIKKFAFTYWPVLVLVILVLPALTYLFFPGFPITDDGSWMIIRFSAFYQDFINGQIPVRLLSRLNFGYGYPVANFLYPGFMYFAVPIKPFLGFINSIKIIIALSFIFSAGFVYLWLSKLFSRLASFTGSIIFTYLPYHLFDLYKRGSAGEVFAFVWVAFSFWMIEYNNPLLLSIGIFLLAISHNTLFLLFLPVLFIYAFFRKTIRVKNLVISFVLGILMSSFFTIPAIVELVYTNFLSTKISDVSSYFANIELIGYLSILILVVSTVAFYLNRKKDFVLFFLFAVSILSILFSSQLSSFFWQVIPSSFIQFPFRFLSLSLFSSAFLAAYAVDKLSKYKYLIVAVLLIPLFFSVNFATVKEFNLQGDDFYSTNEATTTVQDEYMPRWVKQKPTARPQDRVVVVRGNGEIANVVDRGNFLTFDFASKTPAVVRISKIYYPGWKAYSNGSEKAVFYENNIGLMELKLNSGTSKIELMFGETPLRLIADAISILSLCAALLFFIKYKNEVN